jgi:hypothetical protein
MSSFLLYHRHSAADCAIAFAAWKGHSNRLRTAPNLSTCAFGAHEIWWAVDAEDEREAMDLLPSYVARRTVAVEVCPVEIR